MSAVVDTARGENEEYTDGADRPLGSYIGDLALMTVTTHKVSRGSSPRIR